MKTVELLSPAKNKEVAIAAINCGADAVYIGAPSFGARYAAANSLDDIADVVSYAHKFRCRVFVTFNVVIFDDEIDEAEKLIQQLYEIGVDALIIQDLGILKMKLPPIELHASTQMHNFDLERIKFLDSLGFKRIVLARELSLDEIKKIRSEVKAELEVFIHGALCVSLSGQCYMSAYMFSRSANRGECAQPCRQKWSLKDSTGKVLCRDRYLLSLRDLNMSDYLSQLVNIGVNSFKIEGRLKSLDYVANITSYYHEKLSNMEGVKCASTSMVPLSLDACLEKSFNRGFTSYFANGRGSGMANFVTPKSMGQYVGKVKRIQNNKFSLDSDVLISNGDGLCYVANGELQGIRANSVENGVISCVNAPSFNVGTEIYRNMDMEFQRNVEHFVVHRRIPVNCFLKNVNSKLLVSVIDADGVEVSYESPETFEEARSANQIDRIKSQFIKSGDTSFFVQSVQYDGTALFIPAAIANELRRSVLNTLELKREKLLVPSMPAIINDDAKCPENIDWKYNVSNSKAEEFYVEHGAKNVSKGFEVCNGKPQTDGGKNQLMRTRYCLLHEMGRCKKLKSNDDIKFPLFLFNDRECFELEFDCKTCFMNVLV